MAVPHGDRPDQQAQDASAHATADHLVGMSFDKPTRADEVLLSIVHLSQEGEIALADAVVVVKDDGGRVHVRQTTDPGPVQGGLSGSIWGMFVGLLFGGPLIGGLVGAGAGALMTKLVDVGLDDGWVKQVGKWLDPGTSALLLLVTDGLSPTVVQELGRFEGRVLYCTFPEAVRRELVRVLDDAQGAAADPDGAPGWAPVEPAPSDAEHAVEEEPSGAEQTSDAGHDGTPAEPAVPTERPGPTG